MPSVPLIEHRCLRCTLVEAYEKKIAAGLSSLFSKFKRALRKPASLLVSSHKLFLHRHCESWFVTNQFENLRRSILRKYPSFRIQFQFPIPRGNRTIWKDSGNLIKSLRIYRLLINIRDRIRNRIGGVKFVRSDGKICDFTRRIIFYLIKLDPRGFSSDIMQSRHFYANAIGIVYVKSSVRSLVNGAKRNNAFLLVRRFNRLCR